LAAILITPLPTRDPCPAPRASTHLGGEDERDLLGVGLVLHGPEVNGPLVGEARVLEGVLLGQVVRLRAQRDAARAPGVAVPLVQKRAVALWVVSRDAVHQGYESGPAPTG
jgi:hypothetical protein